MAGELIAQHLRGCRSVLFLTGAGVSTSSGIPDYRSPGRLPYRPLQHAEFVASAAVRQRYWARSYLGWPRMRDAQPNASHAALVRLQALGLCAQLITQNVDSLHLKAGHPSVLQLHGTLFEVECLQCGAPLLCRNALQARMAAANAAWTQRFASAAVQRPDGDMELPAESYPLFATPRCSACGGEQLKPAVTFFGGNVPVGVVQASLRLAAEADAVVVAGSTVSTFSAFRLVRGVAERGRPVVVVKRGGVGRADALATLLVEEEVGEALAGLAAALGGGAQQDALSAAQ
jgi:NAD-dependent deacetylase sirtuin 4